LAQGGVRDLLDPHVTGPVVDGGSHGLLLGVVWWSARMPGLRARHELERRGPCPGGQDAADDAHGIAAVLGAVRGVDLVVGVVVGVHERDVLVDAASPYAALVASAGAAEPGRGGPVHGPDVEVVAVADDPDRHWAPQGPVAPKRGDLELVRSFDLAELI